MVRSKIEEINNDLDEVIGHDNHEVSLFSGLTGVLLFKYIYHKFYLNEEGEILMSNLEPILQKVFENLNTTEYPLSYCDGLAGVAYCLNHLKENKIFEEDIEDALREFDNILIEKIGTVKDSDDSDFLHGQLGIIYYLIDRGSKLVLDNPIFIKNVDAFYSYVIDEVVLIENGENVRINFGLAHGNLAHMKILVKMLKTGRFNQKKYKRLLQNLVDIYCSFKSDNKESCSLFPSIADSNEKPSVNTINLGWCYGDQPASLILYEVAKALNDKELEKNAIDIAYAWAGRNEIKTAFNGRVYDACFCHGTTSAGYFNKKWFEITQDELFKNNYNFFIEETLKLDTHKNGISGYVKLEEYGSVADFTLLGGTSGIGIVLIDSLYNVSDEWDKFFLMQF